MVNLLADLRDIFNLAYLFISHDLAVVAQLSDRIAVMYRGRLCETGSTADVLAPPYHPYTSVRTVDLALRMKSRLNWSAARFPPPLPGVVARSGDRCPHRLGALCDTVTPPLRAISATHAVACHLETLPGGLTVASRGAAAPVLCTLTSTMSG